MVHTIGLHINVWHYQKGPPPYLLSDLKPGLLLSPLGKTELAITNAMKQLPNTWLLHRFWTQIQIE